MLAGARPSPVGAGRSQRERLGRALACLRAPRERASAQRAVTGDRAARQRLGAATRRHRRAASPSLPARRGQLTGGPALQFGE